MLFRSTSLIFLHLPVTQLPSDSSPIIHSSSTPPSSPIPESEPFYHWSFIVRVVACVWIVQFSAKETITYGLPYRSNSFPFLRRFFRCQNFDPNFTAILNICRVVRYRGVHAQVEQFQWLPHAHSDYLYPISHISDQGELSERRRRRQQAGKRRFEPYDVV